MNISLLVSVNYKLKFSLAHFAHPLLLYYVHMCELGETYKVDCSLRKENRSL